ncbi:Gfo/Idh/MocA family oxidoreductase [Demequina capsici]|uniref:Gfo/Idh/MocA family oxidoreductase n=1 Tax=Demequina capsici TaxID=3075620 RepID=A0AA96FE12_9MICO|nr:Gfo/Idh/MocA family oxidoreductase [Demequina sp. PMTSA13]WNM28629.1 Gfo/Idh/MocA family oxidoreductase [Demequina sp. PMTSA13]
MRLALLGSGMIVRDLLSAVADVPGLTVVAIQGRPTSQDRLEELARAHGIPKVYTDLGSCLADPEVDTVYVGLPNDLHHAASRAALEAGKHVVCEKPFTSTVAELEELTRIAAARGLMLLEAITTVHHRAYREIVRRLPSLGRLRLVECVYSQRSSRYDAFRAGEVHAAFDPGRGGGALRDLGIYGIHFVVGLLGEPDSVSYHPTLERGVDTSGVLVLSYAQTQAVVVCAKDSHASSHAAVQGDEATIEMHGAPNTCGPLVLTTPAGSRPLEVENHPHRMVDEFREFVRIVAEGDVSARDRLLAHSSAALRTLERATDSVGW